MRLECKRLVDKCKGQKFDRQLQSDDDLGIVVTQTGKHEGCIKTCGDNTAIDCGGSSTSLKARFDFGEIDDRQAWLFERPPKPKPSNFFPGVELSQLLFALRGD